MSSHTRVPPSPSSNPITSVIVLLILAFSCLYTAAAAIFKKDESYSNSRVTEPFPLNPSKLTNRFAELESNEASKLQKLQSAYHSRAKTLHYHIGSCYDKSNCWIRDQLEQASINCFTVFSFKHGKSNTILRLINAQAFEKEVASHIVNDNQQASSSINPTFQPLCDNQTTFASFEKAFEVASQLSRSNNVALIFPKAVHGDPKTERTLVSQSVRIDPTTVCLSCNFYILGHGPKQSVFTGGLRIVETKATALPVYAVDRKSMPINVVVAGVSMQDSDMHIQKASAYFYKVHFTPLMAETQEPAVATSEDLLKGLSQDVSSGIVPSSSLVHVGGGSSAKQQTHIADGKAAGTSWSFGGVSSDMLPRSSANKPHMRISDLSTVWMEQCLFSGYDENEVVVSGRSGMQVKDSGVFISECTFQGFVTTQDSSGHALLSNHSFVGLQSTKFQKNQNGGCGGAFAATESFVFLASSNAFIDNFAEQGGAMALHRSKLSCIPKSTLELQRNMAKSSYETNVIAAEDVVYAGDCFHDGFLPQKYVAGGPMSKLVEDEKVSSTVSEAIASEEQTLRIALKKMSIKMEARQNAQKKQAAKDISWDPRRTFLYVVGTLAGAMFVGTSVLAACAVSR